MTMQNTMKVREALGADTARVRFLTVSFDPARDTPRVLRDYARTWHVGGDWRSRPATRSTVAGLMDRLGINDRGVGAGHVCGRARLLRALAHRQDAAARRRRPRRRDVRRQRGAPADGRRRRPSPSPLTPPRCSAPPCSARSSCSPPARRPSPTFRRCRRTVADRARDRRPRRPRRRRRLHVRRTGRRHGRTVLYHRRRPGARHAARGPLRRRGAHRSPRDVRRRQRHERNAPRRGAPGPQRRRGRAGAGQLPRHAHRDDARACAWRHARRDGRLRPRRRGARPRARAPLRMPDGE